MTKDKAKYERSTNYRYRFLKANCGFFGGRIYHCAYCGRLIKKKNMQVDHLIPIHKVKRFGIARLLMKIRHIHNINDVDNLVSSCSKCNLRKGEKMGLWLIKGDLGRHYFLWSLWKIAKTLLILNLIFFLYPYFQKIILIFI